MDTVFIEQLPVEAIIGAYEEERQQKQTLLISIDMASDITKAATSDELQHALDYHAVAKRIEQIVSDSQFHLLESLAETIADALLKEFDISWLQLTINKPAALPAAKGVGLRIERGTRL